MNKSLVGLNRKELNALLTSMGVSEKQLNMRTNQLWNWIYVRGAKSISEMTNLSKEFRKELNEQFNLTRPEISKNEISSDGTQKWLIKFPDGSEIETVFIPDGNRGTLCVSSQVGCTLNCTFCHTGTQKLVNFENVRDGINVFADDAGLSVSKRRITLSTSGIVPKIEDAGNEIGSMLAISLHATNNDLRNELVPINKKYPIEELLDACKNYPRVKNSKRITFEYVMLKGVNDSEAQARDLIKLISGIPSKINLIPFNPWPGTIYECSDWDQIEKFSDIINRGGYASPIRMPRGRDISAACGQLKSDTKKEKASIKYKKELAKLESERIGRL